MKPMSLRDKISRILAGGGKRQNQIPTNPEGQLAQPLPTAPAAINPLKGQGEEINDNKEGAEQESPNVTTSEHAEE